ncbi:MAG: hypothetical protein M0R47_14085 [Methylobacter sp.]|uniref:hypothetical protein n=1 Tax=Methylobacter sp. TaxID=2051955 RepID=UPI0025E870A0|nr:hypothetical protein [Methylobacter sp.]MCK9621652.1 hypothetical protein [Methylobacter sp.]
MSKKMKMNFKHGSEAVQNGKLHGATALTDYFYFFCPKCEGDKILRLLDYRIYEEKEINPYDEEENIKSKSAKGFTLQFQIYCENCNHSDTVKISNLGYQGGDHSTNR